MAAGPRDAALARGRAQPLLLCPQGRLHVLRGAQGPADRRLPLLVSKGRGGAGSPPGPASPPPALLQGGVPGAGEQVPLRQFQEVRHREGRLELRARRPPGAAAAAARAGR